MKQNVLVPVYSSIKQHSVDLQTSTVKVKKKSILYKTKQMLSIILLPDLDCGGLKRIHWLLFERTFFGSYMNSDSCCAKAGGSVVPHVPWKWYLENITQMLTLNDTTLAFELQLFWHCLCPLAGLRKVFSFRCCFGVEFCHWYSPGGNQRTEHGCWVHDRGGAHLTI